MSLTLATVSFVILTRNSGRTIRKCLEALEQVSEHLGEVVVVDGNSKDDTLSIVQGFCGKLPLKVLSDEGKGLGYARDKGWRATTSAFIVMLDSDVVIEPRFLTQALEVLKEDQGLGAVSAKLKPVIQESGWLAVFQAKNLAIHLHMSEPCYPSPAVALHTACTMFRRSALERVGGFDHYFRLAKEDSDVSFKLRKAGFTLSYLGVEVVHLERARFWKTNFRYGRSYVHIAEKHPDMAPLLTLKNVLLVVALFFPPLQALVYLHYLRRYRVLRDLTTAEKIVLPFIEVVRQAVRTAGMVYELVRRLARL
ncbi:MAG: glycosyltransferase [Candidatus Caldarchaeum sp.]